MSGTMVTERRRLGKDGPEVSAIGLGCMSLSGVYGTSDDAAAVQFLQRAINLGVDGLEYRVQHNAGADSDILAVVRAIGNSLERNIAMAPKPANTAVSK